VVQTFYIGPVLLGFGSRTVSARRRGALATTAIGRVECYVARKRGEVLRRRQLTALTNWVRAGARTRPAVLAFEDLHWADPTTLDLLRGIAERGALAPLFVLITARPEFRPPWGMRSHHSTIFLAPLDRSQARHMVGELAARHALLWS
jgi:predicted ATPase